MELVPSIILNLTTGGISHSKARGGRVKMIRAGSWKSRRVKKNKIKNFCSIIAWAVETVIYFYVQI